MSDTNITYSNYIAFPDKNIGFIPPISTETRLGGVLAEPKTDESQEIVIDPETGKLYTTKIYEEAENLIDSSKILENTCIYGDSGAKPGQAYSYSGLNSYVDIPVNPESTYVFSKDVATRFTFYIAEYDENKTFITRDDTTGTETDTRNSVEFTIPSGVYYIGLVWKNSVDNTGLALREKDSYKIKDEYIRDIKKDISLAQANVETLATTVDDVKSTFVERYGIKWIIGRYKSSGGIYTEAVDQKTAIRPYNETWIEVHEGDSIYFDEGYGITMLLYSSKDMTVAPESVVTLTEKYTFDNAYYLKMIAFKVGRPALDVNTMAEVIDHIHIGENKSAFECATDNTLNGLTVALYGDSTISFGGVTTSTTDASGKVHYWSDGTWTVKNNRVHFPSGDVNNVDAMWWKMIGNKYNWNWGINNAWAGARISWDGETESEIQGKDVCCASTNRVKNLVKDNTEPDLIIISAGSNDCIYGVDLGTFDASGNPLSMFTDEMSDTEKAAVIEALPIATFADALKAMLIKLQYYHQNSKFIFVTPYLSSYSDINKYCDIIQQECDYFGIPVIDARKIGATYFNLDQYLNGAHLNFNGMKLMSAYADKVLNNNY